MRLEPTTLVGPKPDSALQRREPPLGKQGSSSYEAITPTKDVVDSIRSTSSSPFSRVNNSGKYNHSSPFSVRSSIVINAMPKADTVGNSKNLRRRCDVPLLEKMLGVGVLQRKTEKIQILT